MKPSKFVLPEPRQGSGTRVAPTSFRRITAGARATVNCLALIGGLCLLGTGAAWADPAAPAPLISINLGNGTHADWATGMRMAAVLTALSLAPTLLILTTSFTRVVIVFSFLRSGLGLQQTPSSQLLIAYSLFITFLIMRPVMNEIQDNAIAPYNAGRITWTEGVAAGVRPLRDFMLKHAGRADVLMFYDISRRPSPQTAADVDIDILVVSFVTSELRVAFQMGFALLVPFLVIDVVVASILTSMGMMMLPPTMVSLPFKVLIFALVDGWALVARSLVGSFQ